jgi:hypothetical protein
MLLVCWAPKSAGSTATYDYFLCHMSSGAACILPLTTCSNYDTVCMLVTYERSKLSRIYVPVVTDTVPEPQ